MPQYTYTVKIYVYLVLYLSFILIMKKLLIIPLLLACFMGMGQTPDSASIIGKSIRIGNLLVAQNDFPNLMKWNETKVACNFLGNGWRLPTKEELYKLYQNKDTIGGFKNQFYWSSTADLNYFFFAWFQDFNDGNQFNVDDYYTCYVRAVRDI